MELIYTKERGYSFVSMVIDPDHDAGRATISLLFSNQDGRGCHISIDAERLDIISDILPQDMDPFWRKKMEPYTAIEA
jgi:hypothetical protein